MAHESRLKEVWIVERMYSDPDCSWEIYAVFSNETAAKACVKALDTDDDWLVRCVSVEVEDDFKREYY
jgi:hypothetical protein